MTSSAATFSTSLEVLLAAAARIGADAPGARALDDKQLLGAQRSLAEAKRSLDACASVLAGEVVRRSTVEAGLRRVGPEGGVPHPGSADPWRDRVHRKGGDHPDPGGHACSTTRTCCRTPRPPGSMTRWGSASMMTEPWLAAVGRAVATGALSVAGAEAIRTGLGKPGPGVSARRPDRRRDPAGGHRSRVRGLARWRAGCRGHAAPGPSRAG